MEKGGNPSYATTHLQGVDRIAEHLWGERREEFCKIYFDLDKLEPL